MSFWSRLIGRRSTGGDVAAVARGNPQVVAGPAPPAGMPRIAAELPLQYFTTYNQVGDVQSVVQAHDLGFFQLSSFLVEQMLQNPRLRGIVNTRLAGHLATAIRWEPGRENDAGRRAVKAIQDDWPLIISPPVRKQLAEWGLFQGVGFAQKHWYQSKRSGRLIPRVEVYHPAWTSWNWGPRLYQVWTQGGTQWVPSPSLKLPGEPWTLPTVDIIASGSPVSNPLQWVVHEPFGQHSWRRGLIHSTWSPWLAHEYARTDMTRASEKLGLAMLKLKYPKVEKDAASLIQLMSALRNLRSNGVIPVEQRQDGLNFDVEALEYGGTGYDIIHRTKDSNATDLAVLWLGHNLTTEAKGGSYAAANVGDLIRGDIKTDDASAENATLSDQVIGDWAQLNFGDRELAPRAVYETDPPALNLTAAQTLQAVSLAVSQLANSRIADGIDYEALMNRFRIPVGPTGITLTPQVAKTVTDRSAPLPSDAQKTVARVVEQFKALAQGDQDMALATLTAWAQRTIQP